MVDIPRDYVELDCREEGKVNLPYNPFDMLRSGIGWRFRRQISVNNQRNLCGVIGTYLK